MILFNLNTKELISFDTVSEYLHSIYVDFWKESFKNPNNKYVNFFDKGGQYNFKLLIDTKDFLKITTIVEEPFSKVFFYVSVYFSNYKKKKELAVRDLLTCVETEFFLEKDPELYDFVFPPNVIVKYDFPNFIYIPEDILLEIDFFALGFIKNFIESNYATDDNNQKMQLSGGNQ